MIKLSQPIPLENDNNPRVLPILLLQRLGDENPIRTLRDYSKPSHEGYRNTIELLVGNNVVPLRSDTIRLVQNVCSFHGLRSEDLKQHLKDFLKLVDSLDLDGANRERTRLRLFQFSLRDQASNWLERLPAGSITTWEDLTTQAWTCFKDLLRKVPHHGLELWLQVQIFYDHVDCTTQTGNDYVAGGRLRKLRPKEAWKTIEKLGQYEDEWWNDTFILDELMERGKGVFRMTTNEMYRPPPEPSRQEEFEHIVMNFILDHKEKVKQLKEYIEVIIGDFMQLSSEVTRRLKDKINALSIREISLARSSLLAKTLTKHSSTPSTPTPSLGLNEEIFSASTSPFIGNWFVSSLLHLSLMPPLIGLYSERQSMENAILSGLRNGNTVKESRLLMEFWPTIREGGFNVGNTKVASIRDPRVKLAHRCIATTIEGRKETTHRVTEIDLYYLYCIYTPEVACNIPYWLSKYLKAMRDKNLIYGGMLVTKIARSFGLLTDKLRDAFSIEPPPHVFKKKSLIAMGVLIELQNAICVWPAPRVVEEEEEADEEAEGDTGHEGVGGSADIYRNMSQGNWQDRQAH
ncbi:hypothetical protein Tco_1215484 [Tanacetum coccineum]